MVTPTITVIGEVRLFDQPDPLEDVRDILDKSGSLHLVFQVTPDQLGGSDALEVVLESSMRDDTDPGSFNLSGKVITRSFGGSYPSNTFTGNYHPDRRSGLLTIIREPLPTVRT